MLTPVRSVASKRDAKRAAKRDKDLAKLRRMHGLANPGDTVAALMLRQAQHEGLILSLSKDEARLQELRY